MSKRSKQVDKAKVVQENYNSFQKLLPELMRDHDGRYALMRHGEVCAFFDTARDAVTAASKLFSDDDYSVQCVTQQPINLGYWSSHA